MSNLKHLNRCLKLIQNGSGMRILQRTIDFELNGQGSLNKNTICIESVSYLRYIMLALKILQTFPLKIATSTFRSFTAKYLFFLHWKNEMIRSIVFAEIYIM